MVYFSILDLDYVPVFLTQKFVLINFPLVLRLASIKLTTT